MREPNIHGRVIQRRDEFRLPRHGGKMIKRAWFLFLSVIIFCIPAISGCGQSSSNNVEGSVTSPGGVAGGMVSVYEQNTGSLLGQSSIDGNNGYSMKLELYTGSAMAVFSRSGEKFSVRAGGDLYEEDNVFHVTPVTEIAVRMFEASSKMSMGEANQKALEGLCLSGVNIPSALPAYSSDPSADVALNRYSIMVKALTGVQDASGDFLEKVADDIRLEGKVSQENGFRLAGALARLGTGPDYMLCGEDPSESSQYTARAWSSSVGWINADPGIEDGLGISYGGAGERCLKGNMWAENIGWIQLASASGSCPYGNSNGEDWGVNIQQVGSKLRGYAWSSAAGWISFDTKYYPVYLDASNDFVGDAWGENIGWISFKGVSVGDGSRDYGVGKN